MKRPLSAEEHDSAGVSEQENGGRRAEDTEEGVEMLSVQPEGSGESSKELNEAIVEAAQVLWWAGGEVFREHLQQASSEASKRLLRCIQPVQPDC